MKNIKSYSIIITLAILMIACNGQQNIDKVALEAAQITAESQSSLTAQCKGKHFKFPAVRYALRQAFDDTTTSGRKGHHRGNKKPDCANVTHDSANKTITIDYGTGCTISKRNTTKTIAGKILITYTGKPNASGGGYTIETQNLTVDNQAVTYKKTVANLESSTTAFKISVKEEGEITLSTGKKASISKDIENTVTLGTDSRPTTKSELGSSSITDDEGATYKVNITKALVSKKECASQLRSSNKRGHHRGKGHHGRKGRRGYRKGFPVEGTKTVESNSKTITIDFGNGACDKKITINDGTSTKEVDFSTETKSLKEYIKTYFN